MWRGSALRWIFAAAIAIAVLAVIGWPTRTYRDFDFFPFWAAGRLLIEGGDPYDVTSFRAFFIANGSRGYAFGGGFGYPLPAALLSLPYAALPFDIAAPAWLVTQATLSLAALMAAGRELLRPDGRRERLAAFALTVAMPATLQTFFIGNVGGFLLSIVAGAAAALAGRRPGTAGAILGIGVFKPQVFLFIVPLLLLRSPDRVRIAIGGLVTSALLLVASFAVRPTWFGEWLGTATALGSRDVAFANVWGPFPADLRWLGWVVLVAATAWVAWWWRATSPSVVDVFAVAIPLSLAATPYVWSHYNMVLGVTALAVLAAAQSRAARTLALIAMATILVLVPWALYFDTYRTGQEPIGVIVPLAMMALLISYRASRAPTSRQARHAHA